MTKPAGLDQPYIAKQLLILEIGFAFFVVVVVALTHTDYLKAVIYGTGIFVTVNAYFTFTVFRYKGAQAAQLIANRFVSGVMGKFVLVGVAFALLFSLDKQLQDPKQVAMVFISYLLMQIAYFGLALIRPRVFKAT